MISKGLLLWLLVLVSYSSAGPRIQRIGLPQFYSQPPPTPYPIWKVHRYSGLQLQPVEALPKDPPIETETPNIVNAPDYPISEPEEPYEEDPYPSGGLGTILSLIPGGLSGLISLSSGSGRNEEDTSGEEERIAEDRLDLLGLKKDVLTSVLQNKKELLSALKRDAIQLVIKKAQAKKTWFKNLFFGSSYPGYYYSVPFYYPKKSSILSYLPFVGHWFGSETQLPDVQLPNVPNLIALKDPPHLPVIDLHGKYEFPYQSGTYVKVDYPDKKEPEPQHQIPSTSYGVPEEPVPVPQLPVYENNPPSFEPAMASAVPEVVAPEAYPYPPESPALPQYPQISQVSVYPYPASNAQPLESYPYVSTDYYGNGQSEIQPVKRGIVHERVGDLGRGSEPNIFQNRLDESHADDIDKNTETILVS